MGWQRKNSQDLTMSIAQYFAESIFPEFMGRRCHWKDIDPHSLGVFEPSLAINPESQGARSLENAEITRSRIKEVHVKSANCAMGVIRKREKFQGELDRRSPFVSGGRGCSHVCTRAHMRTWNCAIQVRSRRRRSSISESSKHRRLNRRSAEDRKGVRTSPKCNEFGKR